MSKKNNLVFIEHILESINAIEDFSKNLKEEKLATNRLRRNAIIRELEIIGEASKNLSPTIKEKHNSIPWKEIIGTRDKIIHHYFGIDLEIIWTIIKKELPALKKEMEKIRKDLMKNGKNNWMAMSSL